MIDGLKQLAVLAALAGSGVALPRLGWLAPVRWLGRAPRPGSASR